MPTITYHQPSGAARTLTVEEGTSVMRAAVVAGVPGIVGECGGQAMCATCHVYLRPGAEELPPIGEDEDEMLDCTVAERTDRSRLGCQVTVTGDLQDLEVDVPAEQV
ncbi:2Fe-2S iron-sulfur cluster-binding protein [Kocuria sp. SM24M-10]|uniref:2Fe-2S iron-sulfur cluster-binding protein n=1 Tax=Kocuria sp. SM24M-10 TaxID=1660349 RepID=UPI00064B7AB9|nr:2Fe-2S iron-sulfur cluster-binding protein [Kocuria sp. SM24M-10]KLU10522.1 ferredoxin [Kocuria sp. SM24M-10]